MQLHILYIYPPNGASESVFHKLFSHHIPKITFDGSFPTKIWIANLRLKKKRFLDSILCNKSTHCELCIFLRYTCNYYLQQHNTTALISTLKRKSRYCCGHGCQMKSQLCDKRNHLSSTAEHNQIELSLLSFACLVEI